jgi:hypothetical protein
LHGIDVPVVQLVQVSEGHAVSGIARTLAEASLAWLGRTLLISVTKPTSSYFLAEKEREAGSTSILRRTNESLTDQISITPDADISDLYYAKVCPTAAEEMATSQVQSTSWLGGARSKFRLLIVDCGRFAGNPGAVEIAPLCHATILTVCASETTLPEILASSKQLQLAGGRLLGTVLYNADSSKNNG